MVLTSEEKVAIGVGVGLTALVGYLVWKATAGPVLPLIPEPMLLPIPECTREGTEILEFCPDGAIKRWRNCENGIWKYYEETCPLPECSCGEWVAAQCSGLNSRVYTRECIGPAAGAAGCETIKIESDFTCNKNFYVTVMDDIGSPVANALVSLPDLGLSCYTDTNGLCSFGIAVSGKYLLSVSKEGYTEVHGVSMPFWTDFYLPETTTMVWLKSTIIETARFEGNINGFVSMITYEITPLPNAVVSVVNNTTGKVYNVAVDSAGHFYGIVGREGDSITATVSAGGFIAQVSGGNLPLYMDFTLKPTSEAGLHDITVGVRADVWGYPSLGGANISATNLSSGEITTCITDAGGFCSVFVVVGTYDFTVSAEGYIQQTRTVDIGWGQSLYFKLVVAS